MKENKEKEEKKKKANIKIKPPKQLHWGTR
jgi:hypothetical protein